MFKDQKGFTAIEGLLIVLVLAVVGFGGYYVWNQQKPKNTSGTNSSVDIKKYENLGDGMSPTLLDGQEIYGVVKPASEIRRGDIIVFKPNVSSVERMIKRVVGLPGDTVAVENGKITVTKSEGGVYDPELSGASPNQKISAEVLDRSFYVVGDNLSNSLDSRLESFGQIPFDNLLSVAVR